MEKEFWVLIFRYDDESYSQKSFPAVCPCEPVSFYRLEQIFEIAQSEQLLALFVDLESDIFLIVSSHITLILFNQLYQFLFLFPWLSKDLLWVLVWGHLPSW